MDRETAEGDGYGTGMNQSDGYDLVAEIEPWWLEKILTPLDAIADEYLIELGEDGLYVAGTDPANVAMVELDVPADLFTVIEGEDVEFGAYVRTLMDYVERADERVWMGYRNDFKRLDLKAGPYEYEYAVVSPDSVRSKDPFTMDLAAEIEMSSEQFRQAVEYCEWCSSHARFEYRAEDGLLTVTAENDTDKAVFELSDSDVHVTKSGEASSMFSLDFSMDIADGLPEKHPVKLQVGEEYPMEVKYDLPAENQHGETATVRLLQAPRIKE